jgi:hypothetical protein
MASVADPRGLVHIDGLLGGPVEHEQCRMHLLNNKHGNTASDKEHGALRRTRTSLGE